MLTRAQVKFIHSLRLKKNREKEGLFVAEGEKMVEDLVNSDVNIREIYSSRNFQHSIFSNHIEVVRISEAELKKISSLVTPNRMLAVCHMPEYKLDVAQLADKLSLVLDNIQDPGNLGTIIRVADWFGIRHIICSPDTADLYNSKVIQSTMGSVARVKVHYTALPEFLQEVKKQLPALPVYGALLEGENLYQADLQGKGLLVIGNESKGISEEVQAHITHRITIPSYAAAIDSLNAAIAAAVICAEFKRRNP